MLRGLLQLTWLEIKIFLREPLGAIGTLLMPVAVFLVVGRAMNRGNTMPPSPGNLAFLQSALPVLVTLLIALSAVISLVTIISIYRESGILKRLRATPLRPLTILTTHVVVKLLFTSVTLVLLVLAGRRFYPVGLNAPVVSFAFALLLCTVVMLSMGFVIASLVRTARFAQPVGALTFYPMIALSGLFVPLEAFSPTLRMVARVLPMTYVVSLLRGIWVGEGWLAHLGDVGVLALVFVICTAIASRVFRWE
jgi:ABC-2 type transport system permease protein